MRRMMVLSGLVVMALAGCRTSLPAAGPGSTPGAAPTAATITPTAPPGSAPAQPQATSSNSPGTAELDYADSTGDSLTMSYSFSSPEPGSRLRQVAQAGLGCAADRPAAAAELVIPFTVSVTLNSDVSMNVGLSTAAAALGYAQYEVVYGTVSSGFSCQGPVNDTGADVPFSLGRRGDTARATAWLVLDNAATPAQPKGSQDRIGRMGLVPVVYEGSGLRLSSASGQAVCTAGSMQNTPVWLHVGGTVFSSQHCGRAYRAPGTKARSPGRASK